MNCDQYDKRTKKYKDCIEKREGVPFEQWKTNFDNRPKDKGLGDVVEEVLNNPVVAPVTKAVKKAIWKDNEDCGCGKRKEALNKIRFSYNRRAVRCFTEETFNWYKAFKKEKEKQYVKMQFILTPEQNQGLIEIGKQLFAVDYTNDLKRGCSDCLKYLITDIDRVYMQYQ